MKLKKDKVYKLLKEESHYTYTYSTNSYEIQTHRLDIIFIAISYFVGKVLMVNENPYCKNGSEIYFSSSELKKYRRKGKLIKLL